MVIESYTDARARVKAQIEELRKDLGNIFAKESVSLLDELGIESFSWTQYTPYFNDGDTCYFGVNSDYPGINEMDGYDLGSAFYQKYDSASHKFLDEYSNEDEESVAIRKKFNDKNVMKEVSSFIQKFDDDDLLYMFGDHVRVTVTRDGATTEDYDHD